MAAARTGVDRVTDVASAFADLLADRSPASVALSGGSTAEWCYRAARARGTDWTATTFWFGDERWVPVDAPDSNEGMARRAWLDHVATAGIRSLVGAGDTPEAAAVAYERELRAAPPLALVHLGLGPDGHTASLFPGSAEQHVTDRWVVTSGDDLHPHPRLTLTFGALAAVAQIVVTVAGSDKREALAAARAGDPSRPASRLVTDPGLADRTLWLVDPDAAG
jgi:6-phosphogluconolactonase